MASITTGKSQIFNSLGMCSLLESVTRILFVVGEESPLQVFNESHERFIRFTG